MGLLSLSFSQPRAAQSGASTSRPTSTKSPANSLYEGLGDMRSAIARKKMASDASASASSASVATKAHPAPKTTLSPRSSSSLHNVASSGASMMSGNSTRTSGRPRSPKSMYQFDFVPPKAPKPLVKIEKKSKAPQPKQPPNTQAPACAQVASSPAQRLKPGPSRSKFPEHAELPRRRLSIWGVKGKRKPPLDSNLLPSLPSPSPSPILFAAPIHSHASQSHRPSSPAQGAKSTSSLSMQADETIVNVVLPLTPSSTAPSSTSTFASPSQRAEITSSMPSIQAAMADGHDETSHTSDTVSVPESPGMPSEAALQARREAKIARTLGTSPHAELYPPFKRTYNVTEFPDPPEVVAAPDVRAKKRDKNRSINLRGIRRNSISVASMTHLTTITSVATVLRPSTASKASAAEYQHLRQHKQDRCTPAVNQSHQRQDSAEQEHERDTSRQSYESISSVSTGSSCSLNTMSTRNDNNSVKADLDTGFCTDRCETPIRFGPPPSPSPMYPTPPKAYRPLPALPSPSSPSFPRTPSSDDSLSPIMFGDPPSPKTQSRDLSPLNFADNDDPPSTDEEELRAYEESFARFDESQQTPRLTFSHPSKTAPRLARSHSYSHSPTQPTFDYADPPYVVAHAPLGLTQKQLEQDTLSEFTALRARRKKSDSVPARPGTPFIDTLVPVRAEETVLDARIGMPDSSLGMVQVLEVAPDRAAVSRSERRQGWSGEWNLDDMQDIIQKLRTLK